MAENCCSLRKSNLASFPGLPPLFCIAGLGASAKSGFAPRPVIQKSGGKPGNEAKSNP